jgi:biotin/methionine sulfoxide reductase
MALSVAHWGAFEAEVAGDRLVAARPWTDGGRLTGGDPRMIGALPALVHSPLRIDRPHVRRGWLEGKGGAGRVSGDEMVPVEWERALDVAAEALQRVHRSDGPQSVFGGSYGWASAGRFHHARTQLRRFLAAAGGFTDQVGNYSWGAADALLPHVLGSTEAVSAAATAWESVAEATDTLVAFGGLNPKNWRVTSGGAGDHPALRSLKAAVARGMRLIVVSPNAADVPAGLPTTLIRPRPNSDTAILLALAHQALVESRADHEFLQRFCSGHESFLDYLTGASDGQPKTLAWAAALADVPEAELAELWRAIARGRVMLTTAWALQRAENGEAPYWATIALAAMLGQIGLPGGGFAFGYGSMNAVGAGARRGYVPSLPTLPNPAGPGIPAAAFPEALANPGARIRFNGRELAFPDIRLIWWAGGNPFHHAQDLFALERAWARPETVIVNEPWWTPTARRADIVFPVTTTLEREDIGGSSRDGHVFHMPALIPPQHQARDDFDVFRDLARRIGCDAVFDEGREPGEWLRHLWAGTEARGRREGVDVPSFDTLRQQGVWRVPDRGTPEVLLEQFRADPEAHALATPSGRIELRSESIALSMPDVPPHPAWRAPQEWLGGAAPDELHLVTNQPALQLHSQLYQVAEPGPAPVQIAATDAAARGIAEGQIVRLWNARGACLARAVIDAGLRPGVVVMPTGAWFDPDPKRLGLDRAGNPNALTGERRSSELGQGCGALSTLVRLAPATA